VTEGVRGEGGFLTNKEGAVHVTTRSQRTTKHKPDNEEEGWRYCQGDKNARRPPELLTRDHISRWHRSRNHKKGGGVRTAAFISISHDKQRLPNAAEYIKRNCEIYHQLSNWPTSTLPSKAMEVGRQRITLWAGFMLIQTRKMSRVPGLFAACECAAGINGGTGSAGIRFPNLLVFGKKRAGEFAPKFAKGFVRQDRHEKIDTAARSVVEPFERRKRREMRTKFNALCRKQCRT